MATADVPFNSSPLDDLGNRANAAATRGAQLLQRGVDKLPGVLSSIGRDVFPAGTGKRVALSAARNINSRVKKRAIDAALAATPYGRAIKAASFALKHKKAVAGLSLLVLSPLICFGIVVVGAVLNVVDTIQNNPFSAVDTLVRVATGRPVSEEIGDKVCENIKERPGLNTTGIECGEVAKLTNIEGLTN